MRISPHRGNGTATPHSISLSHKQSNAASSSNLRADVDDEIGGVMRIRHRGSGVREVVAVFGTTAEQATANVLKEGAESPRLPRSGEVTIEADSRLIGKREVHLV